MGCATSEEIQTQSLAQRDGATLAWPSVDLLSGAGVLLPRLCGESFACHLFLYIPMFCDQNNLRRCASRPGYNCQHEGGLEKP